MSRVHKAPSHATPSTPEKRQSRITVPGSTARPTAGTSRTTGLPSTPRPLAKDPTAKNELAPKPSLAKKSSFNSPRQTASTSTAVNRPTGRPISTVPKSPAASHTPRLSVSVKENTPRSPIRTAANGLPLSPKTSASSRIKDAIAAKRAEVKKAQSQSVSFGDGLSEADLLPDAAQSRRPEIDADVLGRWGIRETVDRARSTGILDLSSRSLKCLPSSLFDIHLGVTAAPLKLVDASDLDPPESPNRRQPEKRQNTWYDSHDLEVLKARSNEIVELQPELALFGSLKTLDLHSNQLTTVPAAFSTFTLLTHLDLSANKLTSLPPAIFSLPSLISLDISQNLLTTLPFSQFSMPLSLSDTPSLATFFDGETRRADAPLPSLRTLNADKNKLVANGIDMLFIPSNITHLHLAQNPLGNSSSLINALAGLQKLEELHLAHATIDDDAFAGSPSKKFPALHMLDLEQTKVTALAVKTFFSGSEREKDLQFDITTAGPKPGEMYVVVGKRIIREAWEIEGDQRALKKKASLSNVRAVPDTDIPPVPPTPKSTRPKEDDWEVGEGGSSLPGLAQRDARAATAASVSSSDVFPLPAGRSNAKQGAQSNEVPEASSTSPLHNPNYYSESSQTLTLPPSQPRSHSRTFSLASDLKGNAGKEDLTLPMATLPLSIIAKEDFAAKLRVLILRCRRADPSFSLPTAMLSSGISSDTLPNLDELNLEACSLGDTVPILPETTAGRPPPFPSKRENTLELIAKLFPSLSILNLSSNVLTAASITPDVLSTLLLPSQKDGINRKGLKILRLEGNRIDNLEGFEPIAQLFKGNRQVDGWRLEELDVRANDVDKLPVLMGLLPLDVFLVENNRFRIPPRKVWEREGTKGLLGWLRGRIA